MAAPKGSQYWKRRKTHGAPRKFKSPEEMWEAAVRYFDWVDKNPFKEEKIFCSQGTIKRTHIKKPRAMSLQGMYIHMGTGQGTWRLYQARPEFQDVCEAIENVIFAQQYEGAASEFFNPAIVARKLGLADKSELQGKGGGDLVVQVVKFSEQGKDDA